MRGSRRDSWGRYPYKEDLQDRSRRTSILDQRDRLVDVNLWMAGDDSRGLRRAARPTQSVVAAPDQERSPLDVERQEVFG